MWIFVKIPNKCRNNIRKKMDKKKNKEILHAIKLKTTQCNVKKQKTKSKQQQKDIQIQNTDVSSKRRTNRRFKDEVLHDTRLQSRRFYI